MTRPRLSPLLLALACAAYCAACGGVPPEHTVFEGQSPPSTTETTGSTAELLDPDPPPSSAPLATYSPPVAYAEGAVGPDGCQNFSVDGLPVVRDCRRLAVSRPVAAPAAKASATRAAEDGEWREDRAGRLDRPAARGRQGSARRQGAGGRHTLSGLAAHLSVGEEDPSAFGSVADLFGGKHPYWAYHPTLPAGSLVEIHSPRSGKRVRVNIYQGDPPKGYAGRIAVLNYAAAVQIDLVRRGRDRVQLKVIRFGPRG